MSTDEIFDAPHGKSLVTLRWERTDAHHGVTITLTVLAIALVTTASAMAMVGLPPIDLHGPLHKAGIMDPLCGGTRAARYTAQGNLVEAWRYNPLGILVVAISLLLVARTAVGLVGRRWCNLYVRLTPRARRAVITAVLALIVLLEIRQQMRADLLMAGTYTWV